MIPELNKGERRGNTVAGAGEGGCGTGCGVAMSAGRMVGEGSRLWGRANTEREHCATL